jgi:hypothetical protein
MAHTGTARIAGASRVTQEKWAAVRSAVRDHGDRVADLMVAAPYPSVLATRDWSVAETAAHVTGMAMTYGAMLSGGSTPFPIPEVVPRLPATTMANLHADLNPLLLHSFDERNAEQLAERLSRSIDRMLADTAQLAPDTTVEWMGGSRLPLAGVFAHLLNELHIHGRDIARAVAIPWRIPDHQAALFFELFLVELVRNGYGILLDNDRRDRAGRIAVEFRSDHTAPVTFVLDSGLVTVEEPSSHADVHVRFRPAALNLMLFHRMSRVRAAASGSVVAYGRRPWLLPVFLRKVRMP